MYGFDAVVIPSRSGPTRPGAGVTLPMIKRIEGRMLLIAAALVLVACDSPREETPPTPAAPASVDNELEPADDSLRPGAQLVNRQGELWGTVLEVSDAHRFENGVVEPGVLVDYGPRMGDSPVPPQWLPRRSAERFTIK
jgi:hypothetical protein